MKKYIGALTLTLTLLSAVGVVKAETLASQLRGRIVLQVESHGEAWYINPVDLKRTYLKDGNAAFSLMRQSGLGISNTDLSAIPIGIENRFTLTDSDGDGLADKLEQALGTNPNLADSDGDGHADALEVRSGYDPKTKITARIHTDTQLIRRLRGRILLQVGSKGEAWYLNPVDGKRYYLPDGESAYQIMRYLSLGITNADLNQISSGDEVGNWQTYTNEAYGYTFSMPSTWSPSDHSTEASRKTARSVIFATKSAAVGVTIQPLSEYNCQSLNECFDRVNNLHFNLESPQFKLLSRKDIQFLETNAIEQIYTFTTLDSPALETYTRNIYFIRGDNFYIISLQTEDYFKALVEGNKNTLNQILSTFKFTSDTSWQTYTSNDLNFSIQYPSTWSIDQARSDRQVSGNDVVFNTGQSGLEAIRMELNSQSLDEWVSSLDQSIITTTTSLTVDGEAAMRVDTSESGQTLIGVKFGDRMYIFTSQGKMFENGMLDTFKIMLDTSKIKYENTAMGFSLLYDPKQWELRDYKFPEENPAIAPPGAAEARGVEFHSKDNTYDTFCIAIFIRSIVYNKETGVIIPFDQGVADEEKFIREKFALETNLVQKTVDGVLAKELSYTGAGNRVHRFFIPLANSETFGIGNYANEKNTVCEARFYELLDTFLFL